MSGLQQSLTTYGVAGAGATLGALLLWASRSNSDHAAGTSSVVGKTSNQIKELDDKLNNTEFLLATLAKDLSKVGAKVSLGDLRALLKFAYTAGSGKPFDDRELLTEKVMAVIAKLPETSRARKKLTDILVKGLWDSLDHPPVSFHGPKYQWRTADGSYNNVLLPDLGKAGMPYAKGIIPHTPQQTQRPDPELLFDALLARDKNRYRENPAGLSTMLFHYATIIIHDIFRTNLKDPNMSDTSSYVDLAPLYGSSEKDQALVRTFKNGLLKPDTYYEERLLSQSPAVNVLLVLYSRYHNYCAEMLLKINEGGRFTLKGTPKDGDPDVALKQQDEALFQTARLITGALHAQIALHDYLRGLTNTHHSDSTWTLDPTGEIDKKNPLKPEVPRGVGNQVSTEFNLMYRFHSAISQKDEKWIEDFYHNDLKIADVENCPPRDIAIALFQYLSKVEKEPEKRTFAGLKRDPNTTKFDDKDLVDILQGAMNDRAGAFGANQIPKSLKAVEVLGIMRAREWQTATLNEFREFFGLKRHETFEDINSDPKVADILRTLYESPDMVEGYPGIWLEESKPAMNPGSGVCLPYTVGRAVFSDAVTLVRSDRFYTIDLTPATLTSWGLKEVTPDNKTLGGSMLYKLIQRGLPGWFPFNSVSVMQPMYTKATNLKIAQEIGTSKEYTTDDAKKPPQPKLCVKYKAAKAILEDINNFAVPGLPGFADMADGWDHSGFMLSGDEPRNVSQKRLMEKLIYCTPDFPRLIFDHTFNLADDLIRKNSAYVGKIRGEERFQIDIVKTVAIPVLTNILADVHSLDLKSDENPLGTYDVESLYHDLYTAWEWLFSNFDPAQAFNRRRKAREAITRLRTSTKNYLLRSLASLPASAVKNTTLWQKISSMFHKPGSNSVKEGGLRWYGLQVAARVVAALEDVEKAADVLSTIAVGGGGLPIGQFSECFSYLLGPSPETQLAFGEMVKLSLEDNASNDQRLEGYMWESFRLSNGLRSARIAKKKITVEGQSFEPGDLILIPLGKDGISMDPEGFPNPAEFNPDRPWDDYSLFGFGQHKCLGGPISAQYTTAMLKAVSGLQHVLLNDGALRRIPVGLTDHYLTADGSDLQRFPTTAKVTFKEYTRKPSRRQAPIYVLPPSAKGEKTTAWNKQESHGKHGIIPAVLHTLVRPQDIGAEIEAIEHNHAENGNGSESSWDAGDTSFYETEIEDKADSAIDLVKDNSLSTINGQVLNG